MNNTCSDSRRETAKNAINRSALYYYVRVTALVLYSVIEIRSCVTLTAIRFVQLLWELTQRYRGDLSSVRLNHCYLLQARVGLHSETKGTCVTNIYVLRLVLLTCKIY